MCRPKTRMLLSGRAQDLLGSRAMGGMNAAVQRSSSGRGEQVKSCVWTPFDNMQNLLQQ